MGIAWADRVAGAEGRAIGTVMLLGAAWAAVSILILFVVIGAFPDRELEVRGVGDPEE